MEQDKAIVYKISFINYQQQTADYLFYVLVQKRLQLTLTWIHTTGQFFYLVYMLVFLFSCPQVMQIFAALILAVIENMQFIMKSGAGIYPCHPQQQDKFEVYTMHKSMTTFIVLHYVCSPIKCSFHAAYMEILNCNMCFFFHLTGQQFGASWTNLFTILIGQAAFILLKYS